MEELPRITVAYDVPSGVRPRARWALEQLLSTASVRYREVAPGHDPDVGYGCAGSRLTLAHDPDAWSFTRAAPPGPTAADEPLPECDALAATFWHLARVEELLAEQSGDRDAFDGHGRFHAEASALHGAAGHDPQRGVLAPVDLIARHVRQGLALQPASLDGAGRWLLALTHDIDVPRRHTRAGIRRAARTVAKGPGGRIAALLALVALPAWLLLRRDPWTNAASIARMELRASARSTSYLLFGRRVAQDGERATLGGLDRYARDAHAGGGQLGLHGSYSVTDDPAQLDRELAQLRSLGAELGVGDAPVDHRFHYLRHRPWHAWPLLDGRGIRSDSSLGYASMPGLRAGFSHPFLAWDHDADRPLELVILPLAFMDATLEPRYLDASPRAARQMFASMIDWFVEERSAVSVLWHNDQLCAGPGSWRSTRLYRWMVRRVIRRGGACVDAGTIVESFLAHVEAQQR